MLTGGQGRGVVPASLSRLLSRATCTAHRVGRAGLTTVAPWRQRRFVVCAVARSGTGYASQVFTALGHPCGHEALFNPRRASIQSRTLQGDSSWLALPHLRRLPDDVLIYHQVRNPLDVIGSLVGNGIMVRSSPYMTFVADHRPEVMKHDDGLLRAAAFWMRWNADLLDLATAGRVVARFRLEDLTFHHLRAVTRPLGHAPNEHRARRRVDAVSRTYNSRPHSRQVTAQELRDRGAYDDVAALATALGYDLDRDCDARATTGGGAPGGSANSIRGDEVAQRPLEEVRG